jgi:hypothetical protein
MHRFGRVKEGKRGKASHIRGTINFEHMKGASWYIYVDAVIGG